MKNAKRLTILLAIGVLAIAILLGQEFSGMSSITGDVIINIIGGNIVVTRNPQEPQPQVSHFNGYSFIPTLVFICVIAITSVYFYKKK